MERIDVKVEAEFGSGFQREFYLKALRAVLAAISYQFRGGHRKNKILTTVSAGEDQDVF